MSDLVDNLRSEAGNVMQYGAGQFTDKQLYKAADEIERLRSQIQEMVKKAADNNLEGYREIGSKLVTAMNEIDRLNSKLRKHTKALNYCIGKISDPGQLDYIRKLLRNA